MNIINTNLKVLNETVSKRDIGLSHRLGKFKQKDERQTRSVASKFRPPRPIIVRLNSYNLRHEVFKVKRNLKGSRTMITENLTKKRHELLKKAIEKLGKGKVWSNDGRITTKIDNKYIVINDESDLENLFE